VADYNRGIKLPGEILNRQKMRSLLAAYNRGPSGSRNRTLLVVLWRAGLRGDLSNRGYLLKVPHS
jgi:hypothetical protein